MFTGNPSNTIEPDHQLSAYAWRATLFPLIGHNGDFQTVVGGQGDFQVVEQERITREAFRQKDEPMSAESVWEKGFCKGLRRSSKRDHQTSDIESKRQLSALDEIGML